MTFKVTARSLSLLGIQIHFPPHLIHSSLLIHPLRSLSLGKGADAEAVGCNAGEATSFTDLFPAMIHDLVDMRGGQPGLV